jgi:hypothetical protein
VADGVRTPSIRDFLILDLRRAFRWCISHLLCKGDSRGVHLFFVCNLRCDERSPLNAGALCKVDFLRSEVCSLSRIQSNQALHSYVFTVEEVSIVI